MTGSAGAELGQPGLRHGPARVARLGADRAVGVRAEERAAVILPGLDVVPRDLDSGDTVVGAHGLAGEGVAHPGVSRVGVAADRRAVAKLFLAEAGLVLLVVVRREDHAVVVRAGQDVGLAVVGETRDVAVQVGEGFEQLDQGSLETASECVKPTPPPPPCGFSTETSRPAES